jgi:TRAP-type C4-dicarboxylate transport system permease small subunit
MIWIGIFGGAYTFAIKRHLALEMLMPKLNLKNQYWLQIFINLLVVIFAYAVLVYGGSSIVS